MDELYHEATTKEVRAMLEKNVERWIEEWKAGGKAEGEAQGWIRGRIEERRRLAVKMLSSGMPLSRVAELTEIEEEELLKLTENETN